MDRLYPIKFIPQFKEKIWGGQRLKEYLGKELPDNKPYGESWEISAVDDNLSEVNNGTFKGQNIIEVINTLGKDLLGKIVFEKYDGKFPLLIKFLDAQRELSIQTHPDDKLARKRGMDFGKTEMWYIMDSIKGAHLNRGFNKEIDRKKFKSLVEKNEITSVLKKVEVEQDDVLFIPAGTIHNIGEGILLAEIQQSSDATYRVYDFNRKDPNGKTRELHIEESCDALNFEKIKDLKMHPERHINERVELVRSEHFLTNRITIHNSFDFNYSNKNSFRILICIHGSGRINGDFESVHVKIGDTLLIPAALQNFKIETPATVELLECQIP